MQITANHSGGAAPLLHRRQRQRRCSDGCHTARRAVREPIRVRQSGASDAPGRAAAEQRLRCSCCFRFSSLFSFLICYTAYIYFLFN